MKVLVCQHGARHRYAVARILEEAGMLSRLYTDSSRYSPLGRLCRPLGPRLGGSIGRLSRREITGVPPEKIFSTDAVFWSDLFGLHHRGDHHIYRCYRRHKTLSRVMRRWGTGDADAVYMMYHENLDFVRYARGKGLKIVIDVFVHPMMDRIVNAECLRYPGWESPMDPGVLSFAECLIAEALELADVALCPSEWVAEGVRLLSPGDASKIRICPYGSSIDYEGRINEPVPGRIFYAGNCLLRKGLPDLARAADVLRGKYLRLDFRVAGITDPAVRRRPECWSLTFLGYLSHEQMQQEFLSADMFVLPTHAEGLASVMIEAIAAGCPIITTRCAGVALDDSVNGILIAPGDVNALATAIERVYSDRDLRNTLATNTRKLAANYTMDAWKGRLVKILGS
jgi:glycosyltransferase involved in cell wall biosynthesis